MTYEKIEVQAYAGYMGEESPRAFFLHGKRIEVMKIIGQWIEEKEDSRQRLRCFRIRGVDWRIRVLCYDEKKMEWMLRKP
jgi:hypothetical protein